MHIDSLERHQFCHEIAQKIWLDKNWHQNTYIWSGGNTFFGDVVAKCVVLREQRRVSDLISFPNLIFNGWGGLSLSWQGWVVTNLIFFLFLKSDIWYFLFWESDICIHPNIKQNCGFCFLVQKNLRKKCVNHHDKMSRQKCVNH